MTFVLDCDGIPDLWRQNRWHSNMKIANNEQLKRIGDSIVNR